MNTRCKVGDLVVLVNAYQSKNIGKFATVVAPIGFFDRGAEFEFMGSKRIAVHSGFYWWLEAQTSFEVEHFDDGGTSYMIKVTHCHAADHQLRPIRDEDGDDETLDWMPVPGKEETV